MGSAMLLTILHVSAAVTPRRTTLAAHTYSRVVQKASSANVYPVVVIALTYAMHFSPDTK